MTYERQLWIWSALICVLFIGMYFVKEILPPFIVGIGVAYFLDPILDKLERLGLSRTLAIVILIAGFFISAVALIILIAPLLQGQVIGFFQKLPAMTDSLVSWLMPFQQKLQESISGERFEEIQNLQDSFIGYAIKWGLAAAQNLFDGGVAIFNLLALIFITPIVCFYLLRDWDLIVEKISSWLPNNNSEQIKQICLEIDSTISRFIRGQLTVCIFLAGFYSIGLTIIGLDFGLLVGTLTGLISFIPYFGTLIGLFTAFAIAFFQFGDLHQILLLALVFGVAQMIDSAILTPKLVGKAVGLHSVWVIFALMAGGSLFGFIGILLAVPTAAAIGVFARLYLNKYKNSEFYVGSVDTTQEDNQKET